MQSPPGTFSPHLKSSLVLAGVALAILAFSLLLAFEFATVPQSKAASSAPPTVAPRFLPQPQVATAAPEAPATPPRLWPLLEPWAIAVDASAAVGLVLLLVVRSRMRRRRLET